MTAPVPAMPDAELPGVLEGAVPPGVYRWVPAPSSARRAELVSIATDARWRTAVVPLHDVRNKADFLAACAEHLGFPEWFGRNWDALADCLTDLSWWGEPAGYLLVASDWEEFAQAAPDDAATAAEILGAAAGFWAARATPLTALLA